MLAVRAMGGRPQFDLPNLRFRVRFSGIQSSIFWLLGMKSSGIVLSRAVSCRINLIYEKGFDFQRIRPETDIVNQSVVAEISGTAAP
jgi:hypothetical protein